MTNNDMTNDRCPGCGALYALVGHRHRCAGSSSSPQKGVTVPVEKVPKKIKKPKKEVAVSKRGPPAYKYRDPDKWRAYMREYMRKRRVGLTVPK